MSNGVCTPCVAHSEGENDDQPLEGGKSVQYRAMVARANYLSQDSGDIGYAVKELCRGMSAPKERDWIRLKRLGRYLSDHPRCVNLMNWQDAQTAIECFSDADWGGALVFQQPWGGTLVFQQPKESERMSGETGSLRNGNHI